MKSNIKYNMCTPFPDGSLVIPQAVLKPWEGSAHESDIELLVQDSAEQVAFVRSHSHIFVYACLYASGLTKTRVHPDPHIPGSLMSPRPPVGGVAGTRIPVRPETLPGYG